MMWCDVTVPHVLIFCDSQSRLLEATEIADSWHLTEQKIQIQIGKREDTDWKVGREEMRREKERDQSVHYPVTILPCPVSRPLSLLDSNAICTDRGIHCNHNEYMTSCHYYTADCTVP